MAIVVCAFALLAQAAPHALVSRYLFVWAGDADRQDSDFLAVLDIERRSPDYGTVVATLPVGEKGLYAHHTEYEFSSGGTLFANGFAGNRTFLFDLRRPLAPKLVGSFSNVNGLSFVHSFARLPNGHVLAALQGSGRDNRVPGGLAEIDDNGRPIRSAPAADSAAPQQDTLRPYSLAVVPSLDRVVVGLTAMGIPAWHPMRGISEHLDHAGDQIQVWSLSQLKVIKTIELPAAPDGNAQRAPSEPRVLADGKTVLVMTMSCGLFRVAGLEGLEPTAELVYSAGVTGCGVPVVIGHYWMMPSGGTHRVLSLDVAEPSHIRAVSTLQLDEKQQVHWLASDGSRMVIVNVADSEHRIWMADVDPTTGALSIDDGFRDPGSDKPGVSFDRASWPHGSTGDAFPHGSVFAR